MRLLPVLLAGLALLLPACTPDRGGDVTIDPTVGDTEPSSVATAATDPATSLATDVPGPSPSTPGAGGDDDAGDPLPSTPPTPGTVPPADEPTAPGTAPTAAPAAEPAADPAAVALALQEVAVLDAPTAMAVRAGDHTLYVAERAGRVRGIAPDGTVGDPIIDISSRTTTGGERGLLGLAWSADGGTLYLSSTDPDGANVLEAIDVVDGVLRSADRRVLLRVPQPASNHNGGDLHVGPDGMLWWALGDGGAADDRFGNGQRPDTLLGTLLRIDPDGGDPYAIPADNPWAGGGAGAPEVWAYGLRNPWRFSFDPATGSLWVADVGQDALEEVDRVPAAAPGLNYGWPRFEGDRPFDGQPADGPTVEPVHTYDHGRGCSITGGHVYRGRALDQRMVGAYLYSDFCDGRIFALVVTADGQVAADVDTGLAVRSPVSFGRDGAGELYVLSLDGPVMKVVQG